MAIFKNYKCPNGLPPDECRHAPQLINDIASYFSKKNQAKKVQEVVTNEPNSKTTKRINEQSKNINKVRSR